MTYLSNQVKQRFAMKRVIDRTLYDTETAEHLAEYAPELKHWDTKHFEERLYKHAEGEYFLHVLRWHFSDGRYVKVYSEENTTDEEITPMTKEEALDWCEDRSICTDTVLEEFGDLIET